jgi:hypothetical protein
MVEKGVMEGPAVPVVRVVVVGREVRAARAVVEATAVVQSAWVRGEAAGMVGMGATAALGEMGPTGAAVAPVVMVGKLVMVGPYT